MPPVKGLDVTHHWAGYLVSSCLCSQRSQSQAPGAWDAWHRCSACHLTMATQDPGISRFPWHESHTPDPVAFACVPCSFMDLELDRPWALAVWALKLQPLSNSNHCLADPVMNSAWYLWLCGMVQPERTTHVCSW